MPRRVQVLLRDVCFFEDGTPVIKTHVTPPTPTAPFLQSLPSPYNNSSSSSDKDAQFSDSLASSEGEPVAPIESISSNTSYQSCTSTVSDSSHPRALQDRLHDLTLRLQTMHATSLAKCETLRAHQAAETSVARHGSSEATARHSCRTTSVSLVPEGCASSSVAPVEAS